MKEKKCKMKKNMAAMDVLKITLYIALLTILNSICMVSAVEVKPSRRIEAVKKPVPGNRTPIIKKMSAMVVSKKKEGGSGGGDATCLCPDMITPVMGKIKQTAVTPPKKKEGGAPGGRIDPAKAKEAKEKLMTCVCPKKGDRTIKFSGINVRPTPGQKIILTRKIHGSRVEPKPMATQKPTGKIMDDTRTTFCFSKEIAVSTNIKRLFEKVKMAAGMMVAIAHVEVVGGGQLVTLVNKKWVPLVADIANAKILKSLVQIKVKGGPLFNGVINIKFAIVNKSDKPTVDMKEMKEKIQRLVIMTKPKGVSITLKENKLSKTISEDSGNLPIKLSDVAEIKHPKYDLSFNTNSEGTVNKMDAEKVLRMYAEMIKDMQRYSVPVIYLKKVDYRLGKWTFHEYTKEEEKKEEGDKGPGDGKGDKGPGDGKGDKGPGDGKDKGGKLSVSRSMHTARKTVRPTVGGGMVKPSFTKGGIVRPSKGGPSFTKGGEIKKPKRTVYTKPIKPTMSKKVAVKVTRTKPEPIKPTRSKVIPEPKKSAIVKKPPPQRKKQRKRRSLSSVRARVQAEQKKKLELQRLKGRPMGGNTYYKITPTSKVTFKPHPNKHGKAVLTLVFGVRNSKTRRFSVMATLTLTVAIKNANDPPSLKRTMVYAPFLPYKMKGESNGFEVGKLAKDKVLYDPDSNRVGIAVVYGEKTSIGNFQYKCKGKAWTDINIKNSLPLGKSKMKGGIKALFLTPDDSVRFSAAKGQFWSKNDGFKEGTLHFLAWDMSNNKLCGEASLNETESVKGASYLSYLRGAGRLIQLRRGCNNVPGTVPFFDACNTCMGDNSTCKGCDGKIKSKAKLDRCMVCSGGSTGKRPNALIDCAGTCNKSRIDKDCDVCQVIGFKTPKDCNGDCLGRAVKNRCGVCVLGKTKKPLFSGMDACGVCNGKNSTCKDCAGIPNGKNETDLCGNCLRRDDELFNAACGPKLGKFYPTVVFKTKKGITIEIKSAKFVKAAQNVKRERRNARRVAVKKVAVVKGVNCRFNNMAAVKVLATTKGPSMTIKALAPASLPAGEYKIFCKFPDGREASASQMFKVIDLAEIKVEKILPELSMAMSKEDVTLTVKGSGFVNTTELACFYGDWRSKLKTEFVSSTEIKCILDKAKTKRSRKANVMIRLSSEKTMGSKINKLYAAHKLAFKPPKMVSAKFTKKLSSVIITFDGKGKLAKGISCKDLFPKNYTSFGKKARCIFTSNRIIIYLIGSPTLRGGKIFLDRTKILAQARVTNPPATMQEQSVTLAAPEVKTIKPLIVQVRGTKQVGVCDRIKLEVFIPGGNPGRLKYAWSVNMHEDESPLDKELSDKLEALQKYIKKFKRSVVLPARISPFLGRKFTFTITVTNFLNMAFAKNFTVHRTNKTDPQVRLSRRKLTVRAAQQVTIKAFSKVSSCIDLKSMSRKLYYQWEITPAVDLATEKMNSPRLVIPRKLLKGNTTYKVSIEVGMSEDPDINVKDEATVQTLSSKLEPVVDGLQTVSISDMLELSALKSFDPDGNKEGFNVSYEWQVLNHDKSAVFLEKERLKLPSEAEVKLNVSESLRPRRRYLVVLKYRVGGRVASKVHRLRVVVGSPPKIRVRTLPGVKNPSNKIAIVALVKDFIPGTYEWKCEEVESTEEKTYGMVDLETVNLTKIEGRFRRGLSVVALKFKKNSLDGGTYYRFNLTATNRVNVSASAVIEFKTNSVPTQGLIEVEPSMGIAMNTSFNISALEGWTDPDGDELKFKYFYIIGKKRPNVLIPNADDTYWLPPGNITVVVRCIDIYGGYSQATAQVYVEKPTEVNDTSIEEEVNALADEQNMPKIIALGSLLIDTLQEREVELNEKQKEIQENILTMMCDESDDAETEDEKRQLAEGFAAVTAGAAELTPDKKACVISKLKKKVFGMIEEAAPTSAPGTSRRRRRRDLSPAPTVEQKSPEQVEVDLKTFSNLITPTSTDSETMKNKADMLSSLHTLTAGMCKGFAVGEAAGIAENELVHLQTLQKDFTDADTKQIKLGTSSEYMKSADYVVLGGIVKNLTSCGESKSDLCQSACVSSWQMKYDLFSEGSNETLRSNVLSIKLWDTSTHAHIDLDGVSIDMTVDIVVTAGDENKTTHCHLWDSSSKTWVKDGVETVKTESVVSLNNASHEVVTCKMSKLSHLVLVEGVEDKVAPTEYTGGENRRMITGVNVNGTKSTNMTVNNVNTTDTTNGNNSSNSGNNNSTGGNFTSTQEPQTGVTKALTKENYPQNVEFKLNYDKSKCETKLSSDKTGFTNEIQKQVSDMLSSKANVNKDRLSKFDLTCGSIIVKFQVAHASGDSLTVTTTLEKIKEMVSKGEMKVTIDGAEVAAVQDSFSATLHPDWVTPVPKDEGLGVGVIIAIVLCVFLVIAIIVVVVVCVKKNAKEKNTIEPDDHAMELKKKKDARNNNNK